MSRHSLYTILCKKQKHVEDIKSPLDSQSILLWLNFPFFILNPLEIHFVPPPPNFGMPIWNFNLFYSTTWNFPGEGEPNVTSNYSFYSFSEFEISMVTDTMIWSVNHPLLLAKQRSSKINQENILQTSLYAMNSDFVQTVDWRISTWKISTMTDCQIWFARPTLAKDLCFWVDVFSKI